MQLYPGDKLQHFEILEYLASGGYGSVYKAQDLKKKRHVAIKVIDDAEDTQRKKRFLQEIETLRLLDHPGIIKIYHQAPNENPPWYAMEILTGPSLHSFMEIEKPLYQKVSILRQIASAMAHIHDQGYVHRDIKPQNIMFRTPDCTTPVLFDMGLVHDPCSDLTMGFQILGTPRYFSPEQMRGEYEYKQIDVWALGIIMYQWLTGVYPFEGSTRAEIMQSISLGQIENPIEKNPSLDLYLADVCCGALAKDIKERYIDGRSVENALEQWKNTNYSRHMDRAKEFMEKENWSKAILFLEKAYLCQSGKEVGQTLKELWQKKFGNNIKLSAAKKEEKLRLQAQSLGEDFILYEKRVIKDLQISEMEASYIIYSKKKDIPKISKFSYIRTQTYSCGSVTNTVHEYRHKKTQIDFILLPKGIFLKGKAQKKIEISSFLISKYPITQSTWKQVMDTGSHGTRPVTDISWYQAREFCRKVSLNLPKENQWEYAARGGSSARYFWGNSIANDYLWYCENSGQETHQVGQKKPNAFGLHDILGNVWEWCENVWAKNYQDAPRVFRGGSAWSSSKDCYCSSRSKFRARDSGFDLGFRVISVLEKL